VPSGKNFQPATSNESSSLRTFLSSDSIILTKRNAMRFTTFTRISLFWLTASAYIAIAAPAEAFSGAETLATGGCECSHEHEAPLAPVGELLQKKSPAKIAEEERPVVGTCGHDHDHDHDHDHVHHHHPPPVNTDVTPPLIETQNLSNDGSCGSGCGHHHAATLSESVPLIHRTPASDAPHDHDGCGHDHSHDGHDHSHDGHDHSHDGCGHSHASRDWSRGGTRRVLEYWCREKFGQFWSWLKRGSANLRKKIGALLTRKPKAN
ncbi:hypothetical protein MJO28_013781, partial [Puccinia striiformis f. sp. tritici]